MEIVDGALTVIAVRRRHGNRALAVQGTSPTLNVEVPVTLRGPRQRWQVPGMRTHDAAVPPMNLSAYLKPSSSLPTLMVTAALIGSDVSGARLSTIMLMMQSVGAVTTPGSSG
ncbi:hypothetical protein PUR61_12260 [Streptomyces sp. BE20]|nr:hypothetical protein [Streptomyces sp. BE20]MEE1822958.1 hypothetical protein [Streptomyces sp. BE20]